MRKLRNHFIQDGPDGQRGAPSRLAWAGAFALSALGFQLLSCSTTERVPDPVPTIAPPDYVQVPHPLGFDIGDVQALFGMSNAPKPETLNACDADFRKLEKVTRQPDEIRKGARELVLQDPVNYHWCFYAKILNLESQLKNSSFIEEKQKALLETYSFLTPIARAYMVEYKDSRYLRWAVRHYRAVSEWVFYRKLDQSEQMTQLLVEVSNPFALWRDSSAERSVLEKYHLAKPKPKDPAAAGGAAAAAAAMRKENPDAPTMVEPVLSGTRPVKRVPAKNPDLLPIENPPPPPMDEIPSAGPMLPAPVEPPPP